MLWEPVRRSLSAGAAMSALLFSMLAVTCGKGAEPITFRFAPPEGVTWSSKEDHTEKIEALGIEARSLHVSMAASVTVSRISSWTLAWTETLEGLEMDVSGRRGPLGLSQQVAGLKVVTEMMEDGDVTVVRGLDRLGSILAQANRADPAQSGSHDLWMQRENARAAWRERVQVLAGKSLALGETVEASTRANLDAGHTLAHRVRLTPRERRRCGEAQCVVIAVEYVDDPNEVKRYLGQPVESLLPVGELPPGLVSIAGLEVSGHGERLVEPETLIVREERIERRIRVTLHGPERDLQVQLTEAGRSSLTPKGS